MLAARLASGPIKCTGHSGGDYHHVFTDSNYNGSAQNTEKQIRLSGNVTCPAGTPPGAWLRRWALPL